MKKTQNSRSNSKVFLMMCSRGKIIGSYITTNTKCNSYKHIRTDAVWKYFVFYLVGGQWLVGRSPVSWWLEGCCRGGWRVGNRLPVDWLKTCQWVDCRLSVGVWRTSRWVSGQLLWVGGSVIHLFLMVKTKNSLI